MGSILDLLHVKQVEIKGRLDEEMEKLAWVEEWLKQTEKEGKMPDFGVVRKKVKAQKVLSIRRKLPTYGHLSDLFTAIGPYLGQVHAPVKGPPFAILHDQEFKESDVDVELAFPLWRGVKATGEFKSYDLEGCEMAALTYRGPYEGIAPAYNALMRWVETNKYHIAGPNREIYLTKPGEVNTSQYITEIQVPIEKN
jgi:effector-binding domain-containing protein